MKTNPGFIALTAIRRDQDLHSGTRVMDLMVITMQPRSGESGRKETGEGPAKKETECAPGGPEDDV